MRSKGRRGRKKERRRRRRRRSGFRLDVQDLFVALQKYINTSQEIIENELEKAVELEHKV